jgi:hypothetical protein
MASSLDKLSENLRNASNLEGKDKYDLSKFNIDNFKTTKSYFSSLGLPEDKIKLLTMKGVYPYDYMNHMSKFNETQLPPMKEFYSKLNDEEIDELKYKHALNVWNTFNIKNMREYTNLYLKTDVLILADIFENFRTVCDNAYKLDPVYYVSCPALSWDAMLKLTKIEIELFHEKNDDMYYFIERGIRGGICMISNKYAKANNKYMKSYDINKPNTYIQYLDANNLYGWAMSQFLPVKNFKWLDNTNDFTKEKILSLKDDSETGYVFEVDLEYPIELHDLHNDYPLCPQNKIVTKDMLSPCQLEMMEALDIKKDNTNKLICDLTDKTNYVIHYRYLKLCLQLGLKIKKVHKVLSFTQTNFLKTYIMLNTNLRQKAKNDFEKDFFKLMNNSVFGKTMENVRKRCNVELVFNNPQKMLRCIANPLYEKSTIFNENLIAVHKRKNNINLNKPIIIGMCILDLSKCLMYDFYYNTLKTTYNDKMKLLFTDTDSLCYHVESEDGYKDFEKMKDLYDFSEYPKDHFLYNTENKKVIGKFKDEYNSIPIVEFCGLKPKVYSILPEQTEKGKHYQKLKGVKACVVHHHYKHKQYYDCLFDKTQQKMKCTMNLIKSKNHQVVSTTVEKTFLINFENKRFHIDNLHSLAYGHYKIKDFS